MKDSEIDDLLKRAGGPRHDVDAALLDRVASSIESTMSAVRPLPPVWVLTGGLILVCAAVAVAGAARAGFYGVQKLSGLDRALIFPTLGFLIFLAAKTCVSEMIPGSRRRVAPGLLLAAVSLSLVELFALLFHDYRTDRFVFHGLVCLAIGLLHAIPAAILSWLLLRRGFAVNAVAAGLAAGTLAGLAGVTMLELHCPNLQAPHVMLWHTSVILASGGAGALLAWLLRFRRAAAPIA